MYKPTSPTGRGAGRWRSLPALLLFSTIIGLGFLGARTPGQTRPATAPVDVVPTTLPAIRYVACYQQPLEYLAQWKARGCNAAVGPELGNPPRTTGAKWCAEAARLGMGVIGNSSLLKDKYAPPNLVAWICDDEPNETNHAAAQPPAYIAAQAAAFRALNPNVPVLLNLAGDRLTSAGAKDHPVNEAYIRSADVVLADWYPINREANRYPLTFKRDELAYLSAHGAKEVGSFVETDWQWLNKGDARGRQPTPDEVEQEVRLAVGAGAQWIIYFSTADTGHWGWPASYDTTPAEVVARITMLNAQLNPPVVPPPTTIPTTTPATLPTTLPATLPAPNIAPGKIVRVYCGTNPAPGPWTADADHPGQFVRLTRAQQYLRGLGCRESIMIYDGSVGWATTWCDPAGNLLPMGAAGTRPQRPNLARFTLPENQADGDAVATAFGRLSTAATTYGDSGNRLRPIFFDVENDGMCPSPAMSTAQRRAIFTAAIRVVGTTSRAAGGQTSMYWPGLDVDESADTKDLADQLAARLGGACVFHYDWDRDAASIGGESWFEAARRASVLVSRRRPEWARSKVALVCPCWQISNPGAWGIDPKLDQAPIPVELWTRELRFLVDDGWDLYVWLGANPLEGLEEHLRVAASMGRN